MRFFLFLCRLCLFVDLLCFFLLKYFRIWRIINRENITRKVNNMIKIAIVEDEEKEAASLRALLDRYFAESGLEYSCAVFRDGVDFTDNYRADFDIVMMDIEMPLMDGLKTARKLREVDPAVTLIFVTNMANYAVKGYEVDAVGFIVKPVSYFALKMNMRKAVGRALGKRAVNLTVVTRAGVSVIPSDTLVYIEVRKHDLVYHTDTQTVCAHGSLKEVEAQLDADTFARCSNCYLVNLRFVRSLVGDTVVLAGAELPVSRGKKREFTEKLLNYVGGGSR